jgi:hypothetical protein
MHLQIHDLQLNPTNLLLAVHLQEEDAFSSCQQQQSNKWSFENIPDPSTVKVSRSH